MTEEIYLLRISWKKAITDKGEDIGDLFQKRISEMNSRSTVITPNHIPDRRFIGMINYILNKLDDASMIEETRRIGKKYELWISKDEYFYRTSEALFWALQKKLGDAWTAEIKSTWTWFFSTLLKMMRG